MKHLLSETVKDIPKSGIREFFDIAKKVEGVISLSVGEPDFHTPLQIKQAAIDAISDSKTFYTENLGIVPLREAIAKYTKDSLGVSYDPSNEVIVTVGASQAIDLIMRTVLNPNDEVILLSPCYVMYEPCVRLCGAKPVHIILKEENDFKLTYDDLKNAITDKTKLILINYPSNPTGGVMTKEDYDKLIPLFEKHDLAIITDEIYAELLYEGVHVSLAQYPSIKDKVLIVNGFSKAYAMTGYRIGYVLGNKDIIEAMCKIHQYTIMNVTTSSQYAALAAMEYSYDDVERMRDDFLKRRNYLVNNLNRIGLKCPMPKGAFYVFPSIKSTGLTSYEFCIRLVNEEKIAVVPGNAFGESGEGHIRISYAYSINELKEAIIRIEKFINKLNQESK